MVHLGMAPDHPGAGRGRSARAGRAKTAGQTCSGTRSAASFEPVLARAGGGPGWERATGRHR